MKQNGQVPNARIKYKASVWKEKREKNIHK